MQKHNERKLCLKLLIVSIATSLLLGGCGQREFLGDEEQMSKDVNVVIEYARQLLAENSPKQNGEFTWDMERKKRAWTYYTGCMNDAFLRLYNMDRDGNEAFYEWTKDFYDNQVKTTGESYSLKDDLYIEGELDSVACGKPIMDLLALEKENGEAYNEKYVAVADYIYEQLKKQTSFDDCGGNFIHKMNNKNWSYWGIALDGLYMSNPFLLEYADYIEAQNPEEAIEIKNGVAKRLHWVAEKLLRDNGIYAHAYSPSADKTNDISWLRAIGWYAMALSKAIDEMPEGENKEMLENDIKTFFDGMLKYADAETGLWYNVVDETAESLEGNYLETSGSAMVSYALMHAYRMGYVDKSYFDAGYKAYNGIVTTKISRTSDGKLTICDIYKKSGVETEKEGYLKEDRTFDEAKGTAAVIMAAVELQEILNR